MKIKKHQQYITDYKRKISIREIRDRFLIVCEGKKTEPNYFKKFPVKKEVVEIIIKGAGYVTDSLVEKAIDLKEEALLEKRPYNQVWCVFDRDSNPSQNFNRAIQLAYSHKIKVAYSNEAFELWYVLHFNYHVTGCDRDWYQQKLSSLLSEKYKKNDPCMYDKLRNKQINAIKNAERLCQSYTQPDPDKNNPSTTVYKLVQELNKYKNRSLLKN